MEAAPDWLVFAVMNAALTLAALAARRFVSPPAGGGAARVPLGAGLCDRWLFPP